MPPRTLLRPAHCVLAAGLIMAPGALNGCSATVTGPTIAWEGALEPVRPAVVHGSVAVLSGSGRSEASISIIDGEPGVSYRWRIHSGSCQAAGDVVGGRAAYPVLSPGSSGQAGADASLSAALDPDREYAAWVLLDADDGHEEDMACGELLRRSS